MYGLHSRLVLILALALWLPGPAEAESCSCTAPDGSCSASIACSGGCAAICGSGGDCSAQCTDGSPARGTRLEPAPLRGSAGELLQVPEATGDQLVTLNIKVATGQEISNVLRTQFDVPVEFRLADPEERLSIDAANMPLSQLLQLLAGRGAIATVTDVAGASLPLGQAKLSTLVSLQVQDFSPGQVAVLIGEILGSTVDFSPKRPDARVSLDVKDMPAGAVLELLAKYGEISTPGL